MTLSSPWMIRTISFSLFVCLLLVVCAVFLWIRRLSKDAIISTNVGRVNQIRLAVHLHTDDSEECLFQQAGKETWKKRLNPYFSFQPESNAPAERQIFRIFFADKDRPERSDILAVQLNAAKRPDGKRCELDWLIVCCEAEELHVPSEQAAVYDAAELLERCEQIQAAGNVDGTYVIVGKWGAKPYVTTLGEFVRQLEQPNENSSP